MKYKKISKKLRRNARELAMQGLYQWLITGESFNEINSQIKNLYKYNISDHKHFYSLLNGTIKSSSELSIIIESCLDRSISRLSLIEKSILLISTFELKNHSNISYKIIINEAIELAKKFGALDGYKYINGVLNSLSKKILLKK